MKTIFLTFAIISSSMALSGKTILRTTYSSCVLSESEDMSLACFVKDDPTIMYQIESQEELAEIKSILNKDKRYYLSGKVDIEGVKMFIYTNKDEEEIVY